MKRRNGIAARRAGAEAAVLGLLVGAVDLLPPRIRYGYAHPLTRRVLALPLPALTALSERPAPGSVVAPAPPADLRCALVTGSMDVGGIGAVVEMLATHLPDVGVRPVVVCSVDGARAARLRAHGVEVLVADTASATSTLRRAEVDVIALHGGGEELESAVLATGVPVVPVLHNTEIHFTPARWRRFSSALTRSASAIAVSELVRDFHAAHVPSAAAARLRVVPNAAGRMPAVTAEERRRARGALGALLSADLADDVVVVCLARYDAQKNISGLVASFLAQVRDPRIRLVIAGQPSDGAEARRADAIRRRGPAGGRVALLAESDARALLAAADAFVLDSFFEGWPVAATEAAAMGLPLILSDVGGARELVQRDPANAVLIANPSGPAAAVTDASVARARRRSTRQRNAVELGAAIDAVAARVRAGVRGEPVDAGALVCAMMEGHAVILREAAAERLRGAGEAPTTARAGGSR